jgi:hypothetical protein
MDVADIHDLEANTGVWLLFIEGIDVAFTTTSDLTGSGVSSWIGTGWGARTIKQGLQMPSVLPFGETCPWVGDIRSPQAIAFTLTDLDETLPALFADIEPDDTTDTLGQRLSPLDDPAPDPGVGLDGEVITLWDRNVGIERIGPAGQRRWFWIAPDDVPPGLDHAAADGYPAARVTDDPRTWAGRKVAVYRIVMDPDTGAFPEWDAQYQGGSLWWYGTMTDRGEWRDTEKGRAFVFYAKGPASWMEKSLNLGRPTTWWKPEAGIALTGDRAKVAVWIERVEGEPLGEGIGFITTVYDCQTLASGNTFAGLTTRAEIAGQLFNIVKAVVDGGTYGTVNGGATNASWTGPGIASKGVWNDGTANQVLREVRLSANGGCIEIKCHEGEGELGFRVAIAMDVLAWQLLGWDINHYLFSLFNYDGPMIGGPDWGEAEGDNILPTNHRVGMFSTRSEQNFGAESSWDNDGAYRSYLATFADAGTVTLDHEGGTEVYVAVGEVPCYGQHGQPFTLGSEIDGDPCDASGWWIFRGKKLTAAQLEAGETKGQDYTAVALCEWVATAAGDAVAENSAGFATIKIIRFEDPAAFGLEATEMLTEPWVNVVGVLECAPIGVLGGMSYQGPTVIPGWRHRVIPSVLLSSGTAVWDGTGDFVTITPGSNHPGDVPAGQPWPGDIEVADMGCGIPGVFVDWESWETACSALPGGLNAALSRCLYSFTGSMMASKVLIEAMAGAGLGWSWQRKVGGFVPAFGAFDPLQQLSPADAIATLTRADMAELEITDGPQWRGQVENRRVGPYDRFVISVGRDPLGDNAAQYTRVFESTDPGRRSRSGTIAWEVTDGGLRDPAPWLGLGFGPLYDWTGQARERFASGFGPRLAMQQRLYRAIYNPRFAGIIGLGSIVHVIDPTAEAADGVRGINHMGRVVEAEIVSRASGNCCVRVAVELERYPVTAVHVWGPMAYSGVGGWDVNTSTLMIREDHALTGTADADTRGWLRPNWTTLGAGAIAAYVLQSEDGETFDPTLTATVEVTAIDTTAMTLELGVLDGDLLRDTVKLVVGAALQDSNQTAAWALGLFTPITGPNGLWDTSEKGVRLK